MNPTFVFFFDKNNSLGIVRELHGMPNGFRCSDKGEPGDRGEKGDRGDRGIEDGVSLSRFSISFVLFLIWWPKLEGSLLTLIGPDFYPSHEQLDPSRCQEKIVSQTRVRLS